MRIFKELRPFHYLLTIFCFAILNVSSSSGQIFVAHDAAGMNNGSNWFDAFTELQPAIDAATATCAEIWVKQGTYRPTSGTDRNIVYSITNKDVQIYGGFLGTETLRTQRSTDHTLTILSGDIGAASDASDNSHTVLYLDNVTRATVIDGLTIRDGNADGFGVLGSQGGGIFMIAASPTLCNLLITENSTRSFGGGIWMEMNSSPLIRHVQIINNTAIGNTSAQGGGINVRSSSPILEYVLIESNNVETSVSLGMGTGGGIVSTLSTLTIRNSKILNNSVVGGSDARGGGIFMTAGGILFLTNTTVINNEVSGGVERGGGIFLGTATGHFENVTLLNNVSDEGSQLDAGNGSSIPTFQNTIIWGANNDILYNRIGTASVIQAENSIWPGAELDISDVGGSSNTDPNLDAATGKITSTASSAYNEGSNAFNTTMYDGHGNLRVVDGTIDIGASEFVTCSGTVVADAGEDVLACEGTAITFFASGSGGTAPYMYRWLDRSGKELSKDQSYTFTKSKDDTLTLQVHDMMGCIGTDKIAITCKKDSTAIVCQDMNAVVDLFSFLTCSPTSGGTWTETTSSGVDLSSPNAVDFSGIGDGSYSFEYRVSEPPCNEEVERRLRIILVSSCPAPTDPCNCNNPANVELANGTFLFQDVITFTASSGGTALLTSNIGDMILDNTGNALTVPANFTETVAGGGMSTYSLVIYTAENSSGSGTISFNGFPLLPNPFVTSSCVPCLPIPTLGQWGIICLMLIMVIFGVASIMDRKNLLLHNKIS